MKTGPGIRIQRILMQAGLPPLQVPAGHQAVGRASGSTASEAPFGRCSWDLATRRVPFF